MKIPIFFIDLKNHIFIRRTGIFFAFKEIKDT